MEKELVDYLASQRVGCLAVVLNNGNPHTSAVHFSITSSPLKLFIQIGKESKKFEAISSGGHKASFTVGFSEEDWKTFQADGNIRFLSAGEEQEFNDVHYTKNPEAKKFRGNDTAYLVFEPTWWRYSDFNSGDPPKVVTSN